MKEKHVPKKKYVGDSEAFKSLDATIQKVIEHDDKIRFAYEQEELNLFISGAIYQLRTQAGLTQAQLATKAGIPQSFVARIENPESKKKPTLDTLAKIAHAFDKQIMIEIV